MYICLLLVQICIYNNIFCIFHKNFSSWLCFFKFLAYPCCPISGNTCDVSASFCLPHLIFLTLSGWLSSLPLENYSLATASWVLCSPNTIFFLLLKPYGLVHNIFEKYLSMNYPPITITLYRYYCETMVLYPVKICYLY